MRKLLVSTFVLAAAFVHAPALAQDAETLRRELDQLRRQFEGVQQEYQKAIEALNQRLQRIEAKPQVAATPPAVVQVPPTPPTPGGSVSPMDLVRPRQPFQLYTRRGPGQFLFDIGVAGDFVGNLVQKNVDEADAGTFMGRENRFFPREIELSLFGQIDPYARGEIRLEAAEEFEDGVRDIHVGLAEAHLTLLTLPFGTQAKLGLMRNRFGLLNERHQHDLPQIDRPNVLVRFFGEEQLVESGAELTWVPPLPFYLEALVGAFNGDNDVAFGRGTLRNPLLTGRLRTFFELGPLGALQLGVSAASGYTTEQLRNTIFGADAKYKLVPEGWRHPLFTIAGEYLFASRAINVPVEVLADTDGDGIPDTVIGEIVDRRARDRSGWYAYAEVQPWRQWIFGARYDSTQFPVEPGREWAFQPYVSFSPSDFLRFRLAYKHTERSNREQFNNNGASGRIADEILLQATFFLGAHPVHPF